MADPIAAFEGVRAQLTPLTPAGPIIGLELGAPDYTAPAASEPLATAPLGAEPLDTQPAAVSPLGEFPLVDHGPTLEAQEQAGLEGLFEPLTPDFGTAARAYQETDSLA